MNGRAILSIALALTAVTPAAAIVGRSRETANASVVMVLGRDGARSGFCSGVVVSSRTVLTAAHCVHEPANTRVHFKDSAGAPVLLDVARVVRHPGYRADAIARRERSVDLALVALQADLPRSFAPARLATASDAIGAPFVIAGFGLSREGAATTAGILRETDLTLRTPQSTLLLWLAGDAGACTGDSGGPVFDASGAVVGIIAFAEGAGTNRCGRLTQAVRIAPFMDWVKANGE